MLTSDSDPKPEGVEAVAERMGAMLAEKMALHLPDHFTPSQATERFRNMVLPTLREFAAGVEQHYRAVAVVSNNLRERAESELSTTRRTVETLRDSLSDEHAEVLRLTGCLLRANASTEDFERKWYLVSDERDSLRSKLETVEGERDDARRHDHEARVGFNAMVKRAAGLEARLEEATGLLEEFQRAAPTINGWLRLGINIKPFEERVRAFLAPVTGTGEAKDGPRWPDEVLCAMHGVAGCTAADCHAWAPATPPAPLTEGESQEPTMRCRAAGCKARVSTQVGTGFCPAHPDPIAEPPSRHAFVAWSEVIPTCEKCGRLRTDPIHSREAETVRHDNTDCNRGDCEPCCGCICHFPAPATSSEPPPCVACRDGNMPTPTPNGYMWHHYPGDDPEPCTAPRDEKIERLTEDVCRLASELGQALAERDDARATLKQGEKIAAFVPGDVWIKAKERAGFATKIVPMAPAPLRSGEGK